jgi:hypothetical protein
MEKIPTLTDGLHIEIEVCPDRTIFRICNAKNEQFAFITLDVNEKHIKEVSHSEEFLDFKVFDNLKERKKLLKKKK